MKTVLGWLAFRSGAHRYLLRNRAVVVAFHRVDDRYGKNVISCSTGTFLKFLDFFQRYFIVVSLTELLDKLERGENIGRHLAITFDDGYLDNHHVAAPHLRARGLPATFFVATDFIDTSRVPWWDVQAGIVSEWMSWDDVRDLHAMGFELGAHTRNHIDLGVIEGEEAREEILESGARLTAETGAPVTTFSFPYGRANQISEANRAVVRTRYRCCLSAHGGNVGVDTDPYRMMRTPISQWHNSTYQFGLESMLGR